MKFFEFIERHKLGILGTLLFHFILLLSFNWISLKTYVQKDPVIRIDFSEQPKLDVPEPENQEQELDSDSPESSRSVESNTAKNEAAPRMLNKSEYNQIGKSMNSQSKSSIDDEIRENLKQLEQDVIAEQRASGYGYTPEEAEELINSKMQPELEAVPEKEARSEGAYKGSTNIHYKLENRYDTYIYVPVYLCQGGGTVTVNIVVDRNGKVANAKINDVSTISGDPCLHDAAIKAAYKTRFNAKSDAPTLQKGSMTFTFVGQ